MTTTVNNLQIDFNAEGYMTDLNQWTPEIARALAAEEGIELTDKHFMVLRYLQDQVRSNIPLTIRRVGNSGVTTIKEFYALFPGAPLKKASRIAGVPKPVSCI